MGDPGGVGAEIALKAWRRLRQSGPSFFVIADPDWLRKQADGDSIPIAEVRSPTEVVSCFADSLPVIPLGEQVSTHLGGYDSSCASAVVRSIREATGYAARGEAGAVVTSPINKLALRDANIPHMGHTSYLGALAAEFAPDAHAAPLMLLAIEGLRVALVTEHLPLRAVADAISAPLIQDKARNLAAALKRDFGIDKPRIAVAALNPHAGEQGELGDEEQTIIEPAIATLKGNGTFSIEGPFPADTMFHADARAHYDAALCMYHDQALAPLKALDFYGGVNITLGLPFVRTSPDHGVAYDIAGRGLANPESLIAALKAAAEISSRRGLC